MKLKLLLFTWGLLYSCSLVAQDEIPVNMFTGTPAINIPLWTIADHDLSETVSIYYNSSGLTLDQVPEFVGLGWGLLGGGNITREVRGLPDDFDGVKEALIKEKGNVTKNYDDRRGWLRTTVTGTLPAVNTVNFTSTSDLNESTCNDELADYNALNNLFMDTEPDVFHYTFAGISGAFVFDNSTTPQIRLIPMQDIKISYGINQSTNDITSFTITTNNGLVYYFERPVSEQHSLKQLNGVSLQFQNRYSRFFNYNVDQDYTVNEYYGHLVYNVQWMLTKIKSASGAEITFSYNQNTFEVKDTIKYGIRNKHVASGIDTYHAYETYKRTDEQRLNQVKTSTGQRVLFYYDVNSLLQSVSIIDERKYPNTLVKEYIFQYNKIFTKGSTYGRYFLRSLTEKSGCSEMPPYVFDYIGVDFQTNTTSLPPPHSKAKDLYGFYNGQVKNSSLFPSLYVYPALDYPDKVRQVPIIGYSGQEIKLVGADRTTDPVLMEIGSLGKVQYPSGGSVLIDYEPNTYYDEASQQSLLGGGLRVRSLTSFDGLNPATAISKEFVYEEIAGKTSGRLIGFPTYYIPTSKYISADGTVSKTYTELVAGTQQDLWDHLLVRTEASLSNENIVVYKKVSVKRPGLGKAIFEYELPATAGSTISGEWQATVNKFARNGTCEPLGLVNSGGGWRFPFSRNPNFNHERGLQSKKYEYNEAGTLVREITTAYQNLYRQGTASTKVWGLVLESYPNSPFYSTYLFGKYFLLTDVARVPLSQTEKVYDESNINKFISQTTEYLYESSFHKLCTSIKVTGSDGTIYRSRMKYPLDFGTIGITSNKPAAMIAKLQSDFRNGAVIESYQTIQKPGGVEKVSNAELIKYNDFNTSSVLPEYILKLYPNNALTDFVPSTVAIQSGQSVFIHDARYENVSKVISYEAAYKIPGSVEDVKAKNNITTIWGYNSSLPVALVLNAIPDQVAISDFETVTASSFQTSSLIFGNGRTGQNGIHPSVTLSKSIVKSAVEKYILSFWIKTNGTPVDFTLKAKDATGGITYFTTTFSANSDGPGRYTRIVKSINVSSFPSNFVLEMKGELPGTFTSSTALLPLIDDVMFYPDNATISTNTYQLPYGVSSTTDATGITTFYSYDGLGRSRMVRDKDRNIRVNTTYSFASLPDILTANYNVFDHGSTEPGNALSPKRYNVTVNVPVRFIAQEECHDNVTYEWDFGSGYISGEQEEEFTFSSTGTYVVTLRVSKAGYTTKTISKTITVKGAISICAKGVKEYNPNTGSSTSMFQACSLITNTVPAFATYFRLDDTAGLPAGTINWKIRDIGAQQWTAVSGSSVLMQITNINLRATGFEVMCEIVNSSAIVAQSNIIQVSFTPNLAQ